MMRGWTAALAAALVLAPASARAWCLLAKDPGAYAGFWRAKFPELRIPVYLSVGVESTILFTGMSEAQMTAMVRRMVAVHNETVSSPVLYFAGTTDQDLRPDGGMQDRPAGIVVDSLSCDAAELSPVCAYNQLACTKPGGNADDLVSKARVSLQPSSVLCGNVGVNWGLQGNDKDVTRVLLHELGHALGLGHSNDPTCAGATSGRDGVGVMVSLHGSNPAYSRSWRRDDLEGLRAIYGSIDHPVYLWEDDRFPHAPEESQRVAMCTAMHTPPALTTGIASDTLLLGFTDADDRVSLLAWDGEQFVPPTGGAVIDPSPQGRSFAPVAVAHSDTEDPVVLAVWSADDSRTNKQNRLRWALRPLAGGAWSFGYLTTPSGPAQASNRIALGFDRGTDLFLVASLTVDAQPYITAIDTQGVQRATTLPGAAATPPIHAFDIARPTCFLEKDQSSRCTVPYINGNFDAFENGELLYPGWLDLSLAADGSTTLLAAHRSALFAGPGLPDLASGPTDQRGIVGDRRYGLELGAHVPVLDSEGLAADDWPLRIGSHTSAGEPIYRVAARRLAAACGDGLTECEEQCDDGNLLDGDGCSAQCVLEPDTTDTTGATGTTGTTGTTDTTDTTPTGAATMTGANDSGGESSSGEPDTASTGGPGEVPVDAGCDCDADARSNPLCGLGLLLLIRRRARRR